MSKSKIILTLVIILFTAFYVDMEISNRNDNQKLTAQLDSLKTVTAKEALKEEGLTLAQGVIHTQTPLKLYDLLPDSNDFFLAYLDIKIMQRVEKFVSRNNNKSNYKYSDIFVNAIPDTYNNEELYNPNFKEWPIRFESKLQLADNYYFKDSIRLDAEALNKELIRLKDKITSYYHFDFVPPPLMNKQIHKKRNGYYYYGNDPENPEIGDIKMKLSGFKTRDTSSFAANRTYTFTLLGEFHQEHGLMPFYNQKTKKSRYYFWSYSPSTDDFAKARKELAYRVTSSQRIWVFLVRLLFFVVWFIIIRRWIFKRKP